MELIEIAILVNFLAVILNFIGVLTSKKIKYKIIGVIMILLNSLVVLYLMWHIQN